jgi:DNA-binding MarR family transcriptional regulator
MLADMTQSGRRPTARTSRAEQDLGIVDGLVQLSFLVQGVLGRAAGEFGLSIVQVRLLGILRDREPGMARLADFLQLDKSSVTGLVDRAERRGLVARTTVPGDGRAVHVTLTDEGRRIGQAIVAAVEQQLNEALSGLTETGRKRLSSLAGQVVRHEAAINGTELRIKGV